LLDVESPVIRSPYAAILIRSGEECDVLHTPLCELLGIRVPVIQAGMAVYTSPNLAAAVSNAGALGSLGAWLRSSDQLRADLAELRDSTDRPFAVNHVVPDLDRTALEMTFDAAPAVVSFALDDAGDLMDRAHDVGSLVMQQVTTVPQAEAAATRGADIIVAQGHEAGGYAGTITTLTLVPQVVDAVAPLPVVAAGGIADGRGLAAAMMLGAAGVNLGTRFLASREAPIGESWKRAIVDSSSDAWTQLDFWNDLYPNPGQRGYGTRVRAMRTAFVERWRERRDEARRDPEAVLAELEAAAEAGTYEELFVVGGQSAGLINDVPSASQIVETIAAEAEAAFARARGLAD
jgi:nitronate monooxygenase/enoyl-[acyl-carrier protein] reductase II